MNLIGNRSCSC